MKFEKMIRPLCLFLLLTMLTLAGKHFKVFLWIYSYWLNIIINCRPTTTGIDTVWVWRNMIEIIPMVVHFVLFLFYQHYSYLFTCFRVSFSSFYCCSWSLPYCLLQESGPSSKRTMWVLCTKWRFNPLTAKLFNFNFHSLEVVSRWRDLKLQVSENYSNLTKGMLTNFKSCWLMSLFM